MASPRLARYRAENGDLDKDYSSIRTSRAGLSEYTTKRLEELRAKREAREKDKDGSITSTSSTYSSTTDYLADYRAKRGLTGSSTLTSSTGLTGSSTTSTADPSPSSPSTTSASSPVSVTNTSLSSTSSWSSPSSVLSVRDTKSDLLNSSANDSGIGRNDSFRSEDDECVGFASLPEQVHRKAVKRGFDFTLMVVGESGLGKSTLINSLFRKDLYQDRIIAPVEDRLEKTVEITKHHMEIEEKGIKLRLTIVDTPGFNDSVNASHCLKPVEDYVDLQFEQYYKDETGLNRKNIKDNRVHCCLYFISPFGHGLRQMDIEFMKRLHEKVNIVPVIAKADTLTQKEIRNLKSKVLDQVQEQKIKIYELPDCDSDEDEDFKQQNSELKAAVPFAVIGSNTLVEVSGKKVRGRLYSWGIVDVDDPQHCDFGKLRKMLISTHMQDLKELTRDVHYENYRARILKEQMSTNSKERNGEQIHNNNDYAPSKLKRDSSPNFEAIMNADHVLQQKEEEIRRMKEMITKMQQELNAKKNNNISQPAVNGLGNL